MNENPDESAKDRKDPFGVHDLARRWQMMPFRRHLLYGCYAAIFFAFLFVLWMFSQGPDRSLIG